MKKKKRMKVPNRTKNERLKDLEAIKARFPAKAARTDVLDTAKKTGTIRRGKWQQAGKVSPK